MRADVLILGGGPAGITTALGLLRLGISAAIVASHGSAGGIPVEVLAPEVKPELASLGVASTGWTDVGMACYGLEAAWGGAVPLSYSFLRHPHGDGIAIERGDLHRLLLQHAIEAGAHQHATRFVSAERIAKGWRVMLKGSEAAEQVECRLLVDATGKAAVIARYMGARVVRYDNLCCVAALLDKPKQKHMLAVASSAYGWWYATPTPDGRTLVCFVSDADVIRRLGATRSDSWLALLQPIARILSIGDLPTRVTLAAYPCESAHIDSMGTGWIAVGDAGASFDPLSAMGVLRAIRSGRGASEAIMSYLRGNGDALMDFARAERNTFDAYLRARQGQYGLECRFPQHAFWRRRTKLIGSTSAFD